MVSKFRLDTAKRAENKESISRTLEIANNYAGELSIEVLPLDKVELDPDNKRELLLTLHDAMHGLDKNDVDFERKRQDWKSLESLAKTIQDDQLINPIYVYRYGNKCRLIAGERRTLASAIAGKKEIIARIASQRPVGTKLRVLQWVENNERSDLSLSERVASLEAILQEYFAENERGVNQEKVTSKLLSDLTGISLTQARRYILVLQSGVEIRQAISDGKLENIKLIELLCSAKTPEQQKELLSLALLGKSFEFIENMKRELDNQQRKKVVSRGRKKLQINLGSLKPNIVKIIFEALTSSARFETSVTKQMHEIVGSIQWSSNDSVEKAFKRIAVLIESGV